ncbi:hypothetical protein HDZ31DRAFT_63165 [Schizophyllum fasciatum]
MDTRENLHIRLGPSVQYPRNSYFDSVKTADPAKRRKVLNSYRDLACSVDTFDWACSDIAVDCALDGWLELLTIRLTDLAKGKSFQRIRAVDAWHHACGRPGHIQVRILGAPQRGVCDAVVFVSIADVFDPYLLADPEYAQRAEDFRIIGKPLTYAPCSSFFEEEDEFVAAEFELPHLLHEVRRRMEALPEQAAYSEVDPPSTFGNREVCAQKLDEPLESVDPDRARSDPDNTTHASDQNSGSQGHDSLQLPVLWMEDQATHSSLTRAYERARTHLLSSVRFYASMGIYDLAVFAVVSSGYNGILLCAWGSKPPTTAEDTDVITNIVDTNCPRWDISDPSQAIRFQIFISRLRDVHARKVREAFEAQRPEFLQAWRADPDAPRFRWTTKHQQEEPAMDELRARQAREEEEMDELERRINMIKEVIEDREAPAPMREEDDWLTWLRRRD